MLKKFFAENKFAVLGSLALFLVLQIVLLNKNQQNVLGLIAQENTLRSGCYYRLNCPPTTSGNQSTFSCLPVLICPTPSYYRPTVSQTPLSCTACLNKGYSRLCKNTTTGSGYCTNSLTTPAGAYCTSCQKSSPTPTRRPSYYYPTRTPTRYYNYPSPTRYYYYPSPTRYYSYPSPTRTYYYPTQPPPNP